MGRGAVGGEASKNYFWAILVFVRVSGVNDSGRIGERVGGEMRRMYKAGDLDARWNHFGGANCSNAKP